MEKLAGRRFRALMILSIVVPVGLLASFKLAGLLGPAAISETTTLETIEWVFERPNQTVHIDDQLNATYDIDGLSVAFDLILGVYDNDEPVFYNNDLISIGMRINSTVTSPNSFIESVYVVVGKDSQPSLFGWISTYFGNSINLSLVAVSSGRTIGENYKQAYARLNGEDNPEEIYFWATAEWSLLTPNNISHQIEVTYEFTYYNGTAYNKIIQPFQLKINGS
jgi:hypothetical protein